MHAKLCATKTIWPKTLCQPKPLTKFIEPFLKNLGELSPEQKTIETLDRLITFAQTDLASLESEWLLLEEQIATAFQNKKSINETKSLQSRQATIEEHIEEVEELVEQLENKKTFILNPPEPEPEPTVEHDSEQAELGGEPEEAQLEQAQLEQAIVEIKLDPRLITQTRTNRSTPSTTNKSRPIFRQRHAAHAKQKIIADPRRIHPAERRQQLTLPAKQKTQVIAATIHKRRNICAKESQTESSSVNHPSLFYFSFH